MEARATGDTSAACGLRLGARSRHLPGRRLNTMGHQVREEVKLLVDGLSTKTNLSARSFTYRELGTRWRRLPAGRQALLVLAHLQCRNTRMYAKNSASRRGEGPADRQLGQHCPIIPVAVDQLRSSKQCAQRSPSHGPWAKRWTCRLNLRHSGSIRSPGRRFSRLQPQIGRNSPRPSDIPALVRER